MCYVAPEGFSAPYVLGTVKLPEGPTIISVVDTPIDQAASVAGSAATLVIGALGVNPDGSPIIAWKYRPIPAGAI